MKKIASIVVLIIGLNTVIAQEFELTNAYQVTINEVVTQEQQPTMQGVLLSDAEQSLRLTTFPVEAAEQIEQITVSEFKNPGLQGIKNVLKIETRYVEFCSYLVSQYILVTKNGDFISLPSLGNTRCNDTSTEVQYLFPRQKLGTTNQIVQAEVGIVPTVKVNLVTQQIFIWKDDSFGTMSAISENN